MSDELLQSKTELLQDQIESIERSGFFTEKEIDRMTSPLREELKSLQKQLPQVNKIEVIDAKRLTQNHQEA